MKPVSIVRSRRERRKNWFWLNHGQAAPAGQAGYHPALGPFHTHRAGPLYCSDTNTRPTKFNTAPPPYTWNYTFVKNEKLKFRESTI